jgi:hypothetical protein
LQKYVGTLYLFSTYNQPAVVSPLVDEAGQPLMTCENCDSALASKKIYSELLVFQPKSFQIVRKSIWVITFTYWRQGELVKESKIADGGFSSVFLASYKNTAVAVKEVQMTKSVKNNKEREVEGNLEVYHQWYTEIFISRFVIVATYD